MTANRGLFVRNDGSVGTTPTEGRLALASLVVENASGVPRQGLLGQREAQVVTGRADWAYDVSACAPALNRATGEGVYLFTLTGTTTVATTAAPGSGSRYDLVYVKQNDLDKGDAGNTAVVGVVQGGAATSPTKPYASLPPGAYVLAEVLVASGATATNHASVTITQVWRYTALRGATLTVRDKSERDEITAPVVGARVLRLDRNNHIQTWNGTAWKWTSAPEQYFTDGSTFTTTATAGSILVGSVANMPTRSYATQVRVTGQLTLLCAAISTGSKVVRVAVSVAQSTAGAAQGRALTAWTAPGSYYLSQAARTDWCPVGAGGSALARIWLDTVSGSVNVNATNSPSENWIMAEVLPADD